MVAQVVVEMVRRAERLLMRQPILEVAVAVAVAVPLPKAEMGLKA
jgi:hypothetical protein